jgi:mRNA interferase MazF
MQRGAITVVPLTSSVSRVFDFQVLLPAVETGLEEDSKAQVEQIRRVSFGRLGREPLGHLQPALMQKLDAALRLHLAL